MAKARKAVEAFIDGRIDFKGLQKELDRTLGGDAELAHSLIGDLEGRRDEGHLSTPLFNIIAQEVRRQSDRVVRDDTLPDALPQVTLQDDDTSPEDTYPGMTAAPPRLTEAEITADLAPAVEQEPPPPLAPGEPVASEPPPKTTRPPARQLFQGRKALREGDLLAGRYQLEATLGRGGLGIVYRAIDERRDPEDPGRSIAIKVLRPEYIGREEARRMLAHEALQAQQLSHPNIVRVYDLDRDGEVWFITMELLRGERLKTRLARRHPEPLARDEALRTIRAVAEGLAYAHGLGIVHGDVKPSNVFVPNDGHVRLMDFGQAENLVTGDGPAPMRARTPAYASPERLGGASPSKSDDVFGLACLAYEALAGEHPFKRVAADEARARRMRPKRPPGVGIERWRALSAALSFSPENRPRDAQEFLRSFFGDVGPEAADTSVGAVLGAVVLGALLGYSLGILVPAESWLPRRDAAPTAEAGAGSPSGPALDDPSPAQAEAPAAQSPSEEAAAEGAEWVAPAPLATVEIDAERSPNSTPAVSGAGPPDAEAPAEEVATEPPPETLTARAAPAASLDGPGVVSAVEDVLELSESDGVAVLNLRRTSGTSGAITVSYRTLPATADELTDYAGVDWTPIRFDDGQDAARQFVPLISDSLPEPTETFVIELGQPTGGATLGPVTRVQVRITDDD